jgi:hypothetical protein
MTIIEGGGVLLSKDWLFEDIRNVEGFPGQVLDDKLKEVLKYVHHETGASFSAITAVMLGAMSIACQGSVWVRSRENLESPCSLWSLVLMGSGEGKTSILKLLMKGFEESAKASKKAYRVAQDIYDCDMDIWKEKNKSIMKKVKKGFDDSTGSDHARQELLEHRSRMPTKPLLVRAVHENATPEALIKYMAEVSPAVAIVTDELGSILGGRTLKNLGVLCKAHDASPITIDRVDGGGRTIDEPIMTMLLMGQEPVFVKLRKDCGAILEESGFMPRYFITCPPAKHKLGFHSRPELVDSSSIVWFQGRCEALATLQASGGLKKTMLKFSPEAQRTWDEFLIKVKSQTERGGPYYGHAAFAARIADKAARLSALIHFFLEKEGAISDETLRSAISIVEWFAGSYVNYFSTQSIPQLESDVVAIRKWLYDRYIRFGGILHVEINDIRQGGPNSVRDSVRIRAALQWLENNREIYFESMPGRRAEGVVVTQKLIDVCEGRGAICYNV